MARKASVPCRLVPLVHYAVDVLNSNLVEIQEKRSSGKPVIFYLPYMASVSLVSSQKKEGEREREDRAPTAVKVKHCEKLEMEEAGESRQKMGTPTLGGGSVTPPTAPPLQIIQPPHQLHPLPWTTGLCDCFDDCSTCCITCCCPCITFGRIAEIVDRGSTSCAMSGALYCLLQMMLGCACIFSCFYRSKLRAQYYLDESPCADCLVHCCCEPCALCQEYRELNNRGYDMDLGWQRNIEKQVRRNTATTTERGMSP